MAINITSLESALQTKLNAATGSTESKEFLLLTKSIESLNSGFIVEVENLASLPSASTNTGRIIFVTSESSLYFSNGSTWSSLDPQSIVDGAPAALNTLNELAAALNDDANFASTVTTALAGKQNIVANVSDTEIGYLDGVTSSIQTQLNSKMTPTYTGNVDITGEIIADSYNESYAAVTSTSNSTTINCETGNSFTHILTQNTTFTFSNPPSSNISYTFSLKLVQDASASGFVVTWPVSVDWPSATAPTLTATASAVDYFVFTTHDGGTTWYGFVAGQGLG